MSNITHAGKVIIRSIYTYGCFVQRTPKLGSAGFDIIRLGQWRCSLHAFAE